MLVNIMNSNIKDKKFEPKIPAAPKVDNYNLALRRFRQPGLIDHQESPQIAVFTKIAKTTENVTESLASSASSLQKVE